MRTARFDKKSAINAQWRQLFAVITSVIILCTRCDTNTVGPTLLSSKCVHRFQLTRQLHVDHGTNLNILLCRCHCDRNTASRRLWEAKENFIQYCQQQPKSCFEIRQSNMIKANCPGPGGGFAHCLFNSSVINRLTAKFTTTFRRLTTFNNDQIDLELDHQEYQFNNHTFQTDEAICAKPPEQFFMYYNLEQELEKCKYDGCDFDSLPIFLNTTHYKNTFPSWLKLDDGVCKGSYADFEFTPTWPGGSVAMSIPNIKMTLTMVTNNVIELSYHSMPGTKKLTTVPTTTSSSSSVLIELLNQTEAASNAISTIYTTIMSVINSTLKLNISIESNPSCTENSSWSLPLLLAVLVVVSAIAFGSLVAFFVCRRKLIPNNNDGESGESFLRNTSVQNDSRTISIIPMIQNYANSILRNCTISRGNN